MRRLVASLALAAALLSAAPAQAGAYGDALGGCLVNRTSEQDKMAMVIWIFVAMSRHPAAEGLVDFSDSQLNEIARNVARIMMRLITVDCRSESIAVLRNEPASFTIAFETLGKAAAGNLMEHPQVASEMERMSKMLDVEALDDLAAEAQGRRTPARSQSRT